MSFISVEPQSRVVLESHNNSLLAQFDTQLRILADRYLAFFRERWRIEATYVDSLRKLHRGAETIDASFYPSAEPTTTRTAWDNIRDNLGREVDVQQVFMDILANDVIKPLEILKYSNDEARKRIEEGLKYSAERYADFEETRVSKLLRRYQPQQHAYSADVSQRPQDLPNKSFGNKVSALFRDRREDGSGRDPKPAKSALSEEVSEDGCREAIAKLNRLRLSRTENLGDGYNHLEELVFTPTVNDVLVKYMDSMIQACAKQEDFAKSTGEDVENALSGTEAFDLRVSFRQALSFSTPPLAFYRNHRPGGYSNLIFGAPLVDHGATEYNVPKVMRMCIDEVEKRGLNVDRIYWSPYAIRDTAVRKLLHRFESEKSFSFTSADDIHSVAALLKRYLYDLPEPLLLLSLKDYRHYRQHGDKYTENNFSLIRSKIRELHPVHKASLEALLRHLLRVSFHSDKNGMTVKELSVRFCHYVLGGYEVVGGGINLKTLMTEDLIQNVYDLFDEHPSQSTPIPTSNVAETASTLTYGSFLSPELPESAEAQATGSSSRRRPGLVDGILSSTQSSFSSLLSDASPESGLTSPQIDLLNPRLGLSSSKTLTEGVETTTQEQLMSEVRGTQAIKTWPNSSFPDVIPLSAPTSVAEWRIHQSRFPPDVEALRRPQSPPVSVLSSTSEFRPSSATSLDTRKW